MGPLGSPFRRLCRDPPTTQEAQFMIFGLFRKSADTEAVYAVYSAIVAQSRRPVFYAEWGVPDTVTGRFDMICLHLALLFRRMRSEGRDAGEFSQAVFDLFFRDMDRSLREMGAGDLAVPKKIQKMGNIFYGLLASLGEAMDKSDHAALEAVLVRNIYDSAPSPDAAHLATYLFAEADRLAAQPLADIVAGRVDLGAAA
jgi:cytochrome b pre-mRNA-processing protein 3